MTKKMHLGSIRPKVRVEMFDITAPRHQHGMRIPILFSLRFFAAYFLAPGQSPLNWATSLFRRIVWSLCDSGSNSPSSSRHSVIRLRILSRCVLSRLSAEMIRELPLMRALKLALAVSNLSLFVSTDICYPLRVKRSVCQKIAVWKL